MNKKGFSLIELLIVVVIIGIIVIIAVPSLLESKKVSQINAAQATLRNIASAEVAYSSKPTNNQSYGTVTDLSAQNFLDERFSSGTAKFDGYAFSESSVSANAFKIGAAPIDGTSDMPTFYVNQRGVIYYDNGTPVGSQ